MWIKVDDLFIDHPKVIVAEALITPFGHARVIAMWLHTMAYTNRHLTDGFIPQIITETVRSETDSASVVRALVAAGLWHEAPGGYRIHDYHDFNPSAEDVRKSKWVKAKAGRVGGLKASEGRRKRKPKQNASSVLAVCLPSATEVAQPNAKQNSSSRARDPEPTPQYKEQIDPTDRSASAQWSLAAPEPGPAEATPTDKPEPVPAKSTNPDVAVFIRWFAESYPRYMHGAKFVVRRGQDGETVRRLLASVPMDRLKLAAEVLFTTDDDWVMTTDRGIGVLAAKINWLLSRIAAYEARHGRVEVA
jgi:hypothetical protein